MLKNLDEIGGYGGYGRYGGYGVYGGYGEVFEYVRVLLAPVDGVATKSVPQPFRRRSEHIWRVFLWARRLLGYGDADPAQGVPMFGLGGTTVGCMECMEGREGRGGRGDREGAEGAEDVKGADGAEGRGGRGGREGAEGAEDVKGADGAEGRGGRGGEGAEGVADDSSTTSGAAYAASISGHTLPRRSLPAGGAKLPAGGAKLPAGGAKQDAGGAKLDAGGAKLDAGGAKLDAGGAKLDAGGAKLDAAALFVAALFHDSGYARGPGGESHAKNSAAVFREWASAGGRMPGDPAALTQARAGFIAYLIENHSKKKMLYESGTPPELVLLMEADLLDETGALSIVWDCLAEGAREEQGYRAAFRRVAATGGNVLGDNPMVTPLARAFWAEKQELTRAFIAQLARDVAIYIG